MRWNLGMAAAAACAATLALGADAAAQTEAELASRRGLLDQAQQARAAGDHAAALDFASRAGRIAMTASVRRFIAEEQQALGQLAEALGSAQQCVNEADREPPSRNRDAVRAGCVQLVEALAPQVGRLVVRVPSPPPPGLEVRVQGNRMNDALWGVPYVVTPGAINVEAGAPGYRPFHQRLEVAAGQTAPLDLALSPDPSGGASAATADPAGPVRVQVRAPDGAPRAARPRAARSPVGPVLLAAGGASVLVGAVAAVVGEVTYQNLRASCLERGCTPEMGAAGRAAVDTADVVRNVALVGGVGLAAAGAVLTFVLTRREAAPREAPGVALRAGPGSLALVGRF